MLNSVFSFFRSWEIFLQALVGKLSRCAFSFVFVFFPLRPLVTFSYANMLKTKTIKMFSGLFCMVLPLTSCSARESDVRLWNQWPVIGWEFINNMHSFTQAHTFVCLWKEGAGRSGYLFRSVGLHQVPRSSEKDSWRPRAVDDLTPVSSLVGQRPKRNFCSLWSLQSRIKI